MSDLVPEEAIRAAMGVAAETFEMPFMARVRDFTDEQVRAGELRAADEEAGRKNMAAVAAVVEAAAPLILAAELSAQASRLEDDAAAMHDAPEGTPPHAVWLTLRNTARNLRARASVLRGEGHRDA